MTNKILLIFSILIIIVGCSTTKHAIKLSSADLDIEQNINRGNIYGLIDNYYNYHERQDFLSDYLLHEINYESFSYGELIEFANYASKDSVLLDNFKYIVSARESQICEYLSTLDIRALGTYYTEKIDERNFLKPILKKNLIDSLSSEDYRFVRTVRAAFAKSDLAAEIEPVYESLRAEMLPVVQENIIQYCNSEKTYMNNLRSQFFNETADYFNNGLAVIVESALEKINRGFLEKLFSQEEHDSLSIKEYIAKCIDENLSEQYIAESLSANLSEFTNDIKNSRRELAEALLDESVDLSGISPQYSWYADKYTITDIPWEHIDAIQEIKDKIDWLGWGIAGISMIPGFGWAVGLTLDAADFIYGYFADKKETQQINNHMEAFADELYSIRNNNHKKVVNAIFDSLSKDIEETQYNFRTTIYENF